MTYRKDIQMVRGIAVLMVVSFHLNFALFKSGFLGVDIFFVISGFLMSIIYDKKYKSDFLIRRVKRLFPAYYVTVILTLLVATILTTPNEFRQVVEQALYANFFSSNIGFWTHNTYFSKADFNPLLHLWSLGVEVQVYLLLPFFVFLFSLKKFMFPLILISSLVLCFMVISISPKTSFFMTPLRLWEFLIGYGIAQYFTGNGAKIAKEKGWLGVLGLLILIILATIPINGNSYSFIYGHPGIYALVTTLAVALILMFGFPKRIEDSKLGTFLEVVGQYSYSIYLVHFPLIVLFLYRPFNGTILELQSVSEIFLLIILISILSFMMYHLIEQPFRKYKKIKVWILALSILIFVIGISGVSIQKNIFTRNEMFIFDAYEDRDVYRCGKLFRVLHPNEDMCKITENGKDIKKRVLLLGNSHADSIKKTFSDSAVQEKIDVYFMVGNRPLMGGGIGINRIIDKVVEKDIDVIIMHYSLNALSLQTIKKFLKITDEHNISVSFIMPVPTWDRHIPKALWEQEIFNKLLPHKSLIDYEKENKELQTGLNTINSKKFRVYSVKEYFCRTECVISDIDTKPYYFDTMHLTLTGSNLLKSLFKRIIEDMVMEK